MSEAVIAKRYADALFQLGTEKASLNQLLEEFRVVKDVFEDNEQLYTFLVHPRLTMLQKMQFIDNVFKGLSADVTNTLKILVERHRIDIITSVIDQFIQMVNDANGVVEAKVYSVRALSDTEMSKLEQTVAKRFNKKSVKLENIVDSAILGGIKIRIGNTIMDGTISSKLKRIERNLKLVNNG